MSLTVLHVASPFAVSMPSPTNERLASDHRETASFNGEKRSDDATAPEAGPGTPSPTPPNDAQDLSSASVIFGDSSGGSPDHGYGAPVLSIGSVRAAYADARHDDAASKSEAEAEAE